MVGILGWEWKSPYSFKKCVQHLFSSQGDLPWSFLKMIENGWLCSDSSQQFWHSDASHLEPWTFMGWVLSNNLYFIFIYWKFLFCLNPVCRHKTYLHLVDEDSTWLKRKGQHWVLWHCQCFLSQVHLPYSTAAPLLFKKTASASVREFHVATDVPWQFQFWLNFDFHSTILSCLSSVPILLPCSLRTLWLAVL